MYNFLPLLFSSRLLSFLIYFFSSAFPSYFHFAFFFLTSLSPSCSSFFLTFLFKTSFSRQPDYIKGRRI
jgi:hypothetical protein